MSIDNQAISNATWEKRYGWQVMDPARPPVNCTYVGSGNLSVAVAGWYMFSWGVGLTTGTQGRRLAALVFSDTRRYQVEAFTTPSGAANMTRAGMSGSAIRYCPAGMQFWVEAYHNQGSALNWDGTSGTSWMSIASLAGP